MALPNRDVIMLELKTLNLTELLGNADRWNDLWERSEVRLPTARAEGIALWCESFAATSEFAALVIQQNDRLVAGLPLVTDRQLGLVTVCRLPNNGTVNSGDLLVDPGAGSPGVMRMLATHLARLPVTFVVLEHIPIGAVRWCQFVDAARNAGRELHLGRGHEVGVIDILHDWPAYTRLWSRNRRRSLARAEKKLAAAGTVEVVQLRDPSDQELRRTLQNCFAIEDAGWKGAGETSVLKTDGLADHYHREARMMRDAGMLDLWLLKVDDQIIAFDYAHRSKTTVFSYKISFDPAWEKYSPGRLLQLYQLERYHQDPSVTLVDTLGVHCEAKAKWTTRTYRSSRCWIAAGRPWSNLLVRGVKLAHWMARRSGMQVSTARIEPSAARYLETAGGRDEASATESAGIPLAPDPGQGQASESTATNPLAGASS